MCVYSFAHYRYTYIYYMSREMAKYTQGQRGTMPKKTKNLNFEIQLLCMMSLDSLSLSLCCAFLICFLFIICFFCKPKAKMKLIITQSYIIKIKQAIILKCINYRREPLSSLELLWKRCLIPSTDT